MKAVLGGMCMCAFGIAPASLIFLPKTMVMACKRPVGVMTDTISMVNVPPFGMCMNPANPAVIAARAAAFGAPVPGPCIPVLTVWIPSKPTVMAAKTPMIRMGDKIMCAYGGMINIINGGQFTVM